MKWKAHEPRGDRDFLELKSPLTRTQGHGRQEKGTSLEINLVEIANSQTVVNFTSLDVVHSFSDGKGESKRGSTEESDSKDRYMGAPGLGPGESQAIEV